MHTPPDQDERRDLDDDDPAEQGTVGDRDLPPNVHRERASQGADEDSQRQSER